MPPLLSDYFLLVWVVVSVLSTGIALCSSFRGLEGMELIGYGAGVGVLLHGIFGLLIGFAPHWHHYVGILAICSAAFSVGYLIRRRVWREIASSLGQPLRLAVILWLSFPFFCLTLAHVDVQWPADLPDTQYMFKKHTLNVKIQYLTTLPADNYIPYVVTEFFLRDIPFKKEHPLLPRNEVSNRTILMSLAALPFRGVLGFGQRAADSLGKFSYAGREWPNVERLNDDNSYNQFFVIGLFLNSLMLLGLLVLFSNFELTESLPAAALLYLTNPYFISQTIFTWPKAMAAFFVFLACNSARRRHGPAVVGFWAALAYHCHPLTLPFGASLGLWHGVRAWRGRTGFRPLFQYALVFLLMVLPWFVWTRLLLRLPDNMLAQNFAGDDAANLLTSPLNFIWVRVSNLAISFAAVPLLIYPFSLVDVTNYALRCVPMVVGLVVVIPAILEWVTRWESERMLLLYAMLIPAAAVLLLFSVPFNPTLLGWQALVGVLFFLGVHRLRRNFSLRTYRVLIGLQLICNLAVIVLCGYRAGAHLT